jgi:hypothetical protein
MFPPMKIAYASLSHIHLFIQEHFISTGPLQHRENAFWTNCGKQLNEPPATASGYVTSITTLSDCTCHPIKDCSKQNY